MDLTTHWNRDKMAERLHETFFKESFSALLRIPLKSVLWGPIDKKSVIIPIFTSHGTGVSFTNMD